MSCSDPRPLPSVSPTQDAPRRRVSGSGSTQHEVALICAVGSCQAPVGEVVGGGRVGSATSLCVSASSGVLSPGGRARRAERGASPGAGLALSALVRAGAHAYLGPRPSGWLRVGDMMVMGFPLGEGGSGRSVFGGGPREAWRQRNAGSWPRCIGLRFRRCAHRELMRAQSLLAEVFEGGRVAGGIAPPGSLRSRRDSLPSPGSSHRLSVGADHRQWANRPGCSLEQSGPPPL